MKFDVHMHSGAVVTIDGQGDSLNDLLQSGVEHGMIIGDDFWLRFKHIDAITEHVDIDAPIPLMPAEPINFD